MSKPYNFKEVETQVLKFWEDKDIYQKVKDKNNKGRPFYFLQGPPYTSGKIHIGQAWNNSMKDIALRYKRMKGFDVWDRAGYDMHGLPVSRKVMALNKLKMKEDIEKFGVEKFIKECIKFSTQTAEGMSKDLWRLGVWMDYKHAYLPIKNEFIEAEWFLVKKAEEQNRLYEGEKTMTWCPNCATAMAKHECDYKEVEDDSIFMKFKVKGKKDEYLIIWTTTPWTIMFNLAIMVNPDLDYVKAEVETKAGKEKWIVAKALVGVFIQGVADKKYKLVEEFKGSKLEGVEYEHPWNDKLKFFKELKKKHPKVHTVMLSTEYVDTGSGTGLVHCAPGCGPEDYEIGYRNNIPPFNNLDQHGIFPKEAGKFAGVVARTEDDKFTHELKKDGVLIAITKVKHDYPHCERCNTGVIFRKTKQWFFKVEDLKEEMIKANQDIYWVPQAGKNAFHSWLDNLRDNSITKQRYWGTPVPIWRCDKCKAYEVFGSAHELEQRAGKGKVPDNLHKPWIDKVTFKCKCSSVMKRIPEIIDVWVDAGTTSWSCLYYPQRTDFLERYFPADFILEGKDQIRGWFNLLMVASMIAFKKPSFKAVYMHGMITDVEGKKMSKSLGNIISPYELIDKHGADTLRYYMGETKAGFDMNFSWEEARLRFKNLQVFWNIHNYLLDLTRTYKLKPEKIDIAKTGIEEKYILSRVHSTMKTVGEKHEKCLLHELTPLIGELFLELSRNYIQFVRDKKDKQVVVDTVLECLVNIVKILAPSLPFITEAIYQSLKKEYGLKEEGVHLCEWPAYDDKMINPSIEEEVRVAKEVITLILGKREETGTGVRWPLARAEAFVDNPNALKKTQDLVKKQTNVKKLLINKGKLKVEVDTKLTPSLEQEGFAREITRRIQS
ncbi:isoleucine--tRNA ligase, partial [Candidatus Woesearchaeota archaeon]|nr:isoleucine--tRNA ligase [Candidatus Woesearchaeota archaeon]